MTSISVTTKDGAVVLFSSPEEAARFCNDLHIMSKNIVEFSGYLTPADVKRIAAEVKKVVAEAREETKRVSQAMNERDEQRAKAGATTRTLAKRLFEACASERMTARQEIFQMVDEVETLEALLSTADRVRETAVTHVREQERGRCVRAVREEFAAPGLPGSPSYQQAFAELEPRLIKHILGGK